MPEPADVPRPRTAVVPSAAEATAPPAGAPAFTMLADDGATCADGVCALPEPRSRHRA